MKAAAASLLESRTLKLPYSADELVRRLVALDPKSGLALLDSCGTSAAGGRYLVAGIKPYEVLTLCGGVVHRRSAGRSDAEIVPGDLLEMLDQRLRRPVGEAPGDAWSGGCIASFSYEFGRRFELPRSGTGFAETGEPDAELAFYDTLVVHDYASGESFAAGHDPDRLRAVYALLAEAREFVADGPSEPVKLGSNFTRGEYEAAVSQIKEYIAAGDIYQANLTQQFTAEIGRAAPESIFLRLRDLHPAPFAAFVRRTADTVISGSPERFLRVWHQDGGRVVEAWPIKGTRPRGADAATDDALRDELRASAKDRAENVMIVDLLRNDLGRVAEFGSVGVAELFSLQEHSSLFHLVSKVQGRLRPEAGMGELLRAAFPCGSITGAPKIRAMEIIDQLEPSPRRLSMGAIGYFGFDGTADLNVAIRTMTVRDGRARFNVGGGIVADSVPAAEYDESLLKARGLLAALGEHFTGWDDHVQKHQDTF